MTFSNLRWTSGAAAGVYDVAVADAEIFAVTGDGEVTGVGGDAMTVVTERVFAGADDVVVAGTIVNVTADSVTGTIGDEVANVTPPLTCRCRRCDICRCNYRTECRCICQSTRWLTR